jgi:ArsR family transcriptional regulator
MDEFIRVMKALSDPNRVKLLKMLQHKVMCVCEIREALGHRKDGLWGNYFLSDGGSSPYAASLLGNLRHWLEAVPEVQEITRRLPSIRREDICKND